MHRLVSAIALPGNQVMAERRYDLLNSAAMVAPRLGCEILPCMLQPLKEHRCTSAQFAALLDQLCCAPALTPTSPLSLTTTVRPFFTAWFVLVLIRQLLHAGNSCRHAWFLP
jgi:hypothetical protein